MARLDWSKPVNSLIHKLQKAGLVVQAVDDGGEIVNIKETKQLENRKLAVDTVVSVDFSHIILKNANGDRARIVIVLGNDPDEIIADWACSSNYSSTIAPQVESAIEQFYKQWEGKKCPTVAG